VARLVAQELAVALHAQVVIDNRAGASGSIGTEIAARAAPDGQTLVLGTASTLAVAVVANANLGYDPLNDFAPISLIGNSPYVLAVHPAVPATTLRELIALARAQPGRISYASAGNASLGHLAGELFTAITGARFNHVPYKSSGLAVIDVLSGRIELQWGSIAPTLPHIRSGRLRALATTGAKRVTALPEVPTAIESGVAGYDVALWMGVLAPASTPAAIVNLLNRELVAVVRKPEMHAALIAQGLEPMAGSTAAFGTHIKSEIVKWRGVAGTAGIKPE
jgi:tripartite-type tricarboxylate transporter receptor subunit TctC